MKMPAPRTSYECIARVAAWQGVSPGPSSGITYTLKVEMPSGGSAEFGPIRPTNGGLAQTLGLDVYALPIGKECPAILVDGRLFWWAEEMPKVVDCAGQPLGGTP